MLLNDGCQTNITSVPLFRSSSQVESKKSCTAVSSSSPSLDFSTSLKLNEEWFKIVYTFSFNVAFPLSISVARGGQPVAQWLSNLKNKSFIFLCLPSPFNYCLLLCVLYFTAEKSPKHKGYSNKKASLSLWYGISDGKSSQFKASAPFQHTPLKH